MSKLANTDNRIDWIDALRAVAMIFVIYGHMNPNARQYFLLVNPIKLPLFFAISGYLFKMKDISVFQKTKKLFIGILVPYFFLSLFPFKLIVSFFSSASTLAVLKTFFTGEYLWYLPCCFITQVLFFLILKMAKKPLFTVIVSICVCAIGFWLSKTVISTHFYISNSLICQIFMLMGYLFKQYEAGLTKHSRCLIPITAALYIALGIINMKFLAHKAIDVHLNRYHLLGALMIPVGCLCLFLLFKALQVRFKPLVFVGKNTLIYYSFHIYMQANTIRVLTALGITFSATWSAAIVHTLIACLLCAPIALLINRFLPFCVGKKYQNKHRNRESASKT